MRNFWVKFMEKGKASKDAISISMSQNNVQLSTPFKHLMTRVEEKILVNFEWGKHYNYS